MCEPSPNLQGKSSGCAFPPNTSKKILHGVRCGAPWRAFGPDRINAVLSQCLQQVVQCGLSPADEGGGKAAPEYPSGTFQDALAFHIFGPFIGAVVLVSIALDRQTSIIVARPLPSRCGNGQPPLAALPCNHVR